MMCEVLFKLCFALSMILIGEAYLVPYGPIVVGRRSRSTPSFLDVVSSAVSKVRESSTTTLWAAAGEKKRRRRKKPPTVPSIPESPTVLPIVDATASKIEVEPTTTTFLGDMDDDDDDDEEEEEIDISMLKDIANFKFDGGDIQTSSSSSSSSSSDSSSTPPSSSMDTLTIPLPDIKDTLRKKEFEEEMARIEEEEASTRVKIKRSDKKAMAKVCNRYQDSIFPRKR